VHLVSHGTLEAWDEVHDFLEEVWPWQEVAFWRVVLRKQRRSGLTARAFCRQEQLSEASYYAWRREIARRDLVSQSTAQLRR
jgi:hypothetical protein